MIKVLSIDILDLDLRSKRGSAVVKQKVFLMNRKKLHPHLLNTVLLEKVWREGGIKELENILARSIENALKKGKIPYLSNNESIVVEVINAKYVTDRRQILNLYIDFKFNEVKNK